MLASFTQKIKNKPKNKANRLPKQIKPEQVLNKKKMNDLK